MTALQERNAVIDAPPTLDEEGLAAIATGHTAFQMLWAATEFDLFSLLSQRGSLSLEEIGVELALERQPADILMQGLLSLRLVVKRGERYVNAPVSERRLVRGKPECLIPLLGWQHHIVFKGLLDFADSLRENRNVGLRHFEGRGATIYERISSDPDLETIFHKSLSCLSSQANREMAEVANLAGTKHLVDLGGGDGTNAINLVKRHPGLKATVFDGATVVDGARKKIEAEGFAGRVGVHPGNFFADPFPAGADAFLLGHILTIWSSERNTELLRKCRRALPAGGRVLVYNMVANDEGDGPLMCTMGSAYFQCIATGEGKLYRGSEIEGWLRDAGFATITRTPLPMAHVLFEAVA